MGCMMQVVYDLPGNPAHLAMTCSGRQQAFEVQLAARRTGRWQAAKPHLGCMQVDFTGSTLIMTDVDEGGLGLQSSGSRTATQS